MHDTETLLSNQSDTIRAVLHERNAARTDAAEQRRRAERAEASLRDARTKHAAQLGGDWTDANPAVRELRNEMDLDKLGLVLIVRDGQGWIARPCDVETKLSLCAWSPDEVLAWVDGYETAARDVGSVQA